MNTKIIMVLQLNFIANVKRRLTEISMTQKELAMRAGLPQPTVSRILNGHSSPSLDNCVRIARALRIDPTEVFKYGNYGRKVKDE